MLENLGGEYAEFAREVAQNIGIIPPKLGEVTAEPQIQIDTFDVAFIEVKETVRFEFDVATLEQRSAGLFGLFRNRWVIKKQRRQATAIVENLGNGIELEMVKIPPGKFMMGSPEDELERYDGESPQHEVNVSAFLIGRYPITQAQWKAVVTNVPKIQRDLNPDPSYFKENNRPVEGVSWQDAVEFCARLSKYTDRNYRLPSEAEWEYACRAGTTTPFHFGETITTDLANYNGNYTYGTGQKGRYREETTPVGSFGVVNAFGLYDMHGNVWEWCADPWHNNYKGAPKDGQAWDEKSNDNRYQVYRNDFLVNLLEDHRPRVWRGGSWVCNPRRCRSAYRFYFNPDYTDNYFGFRVVRASPRTL